MVNLLKKTSNWHFASLILLFYSSLSRYFVISLWGLSNTIFFPSFSIYFSINLFGWVVASAILCSKNNNLNLSGKLLSWVMFRRFSLYGYRCVSHCSFSFYFGYFEWIEWFNEIGWWRLFFCKILRNRSVKRENISANFCVFLPLEYRMWQLTYWKCVKREKIKYPNRTF